MIRIRGRVLNWDIHYMSETGRTVPTLKCGRAAVGTRPRPLTLGPCPYPPRRELWSNPVERRPGAEGFARYKSLAPARNGMWRAGADYDWSPFPQEIG